VARTLEQDALDQAALALSIADGDSGSVRPLADITRRTITSAWDRQAQLDAATTKLAAARLSGPKHAR